MHHSRATLRRIEAALSHRRDDAAHDLAGFTDGWAARWAAPLAADIAGAQAARAAVLARPAPAIPASVLAERRLHAAERAAEAAGREVGHANWLLSWAPRSVSYIADPANRRVQLRFVQARAFRTINKARADLRAAERTLADARTALDAARIADALPMAAE